MAKKLKRVAKRLNKATVKRLKKHIRGLHPKRRNQGIFGVVSSMAAIAMVLTGYIVAGCVMGVVAAFAMIFSSASPPPTVKQHKPEPRRGVKTDKRVPHGTFKVKPGQNLGVAAGRKPCGARCQYSKKARSTCNCSCLGAQHGTKR
jgi:hypothetical protein